MTTKKLPIDVEDAHELRLEVHRAQGAQPSESLLPEEALKRAGGAQVNQEFVDMLVSMGEGVYVLETTLKRRCFQASHNCKRARRSSRRRMRAPSKHSTGCSSIRTRCRRRSRRRRAAATKSQSTVLATTLLRRLLCTWGATRTQDTTSHLCDR